MKLVINLNQPCQLNCMEKEFKKKAIIIGAGPAGLTAAYELLHSTSIQPIIIEMSNDIGGISKTVNYKGNRIDIGGHRFFSKSERVMNWWLNIMPIQHNQKKNILLTENVLLERKRVSRIYFLQKFFDYPISLSLSTLYKLGVVTTIKIGISYIHSRLFPIKNETSLEDFLINRFGKKLYSIFFKDYTQKVWGVPCKEIPSEWGVQRIKGVSIWKAIKHALIKSDKVETSLIDKFLYPKFGPGQMWEEVLKIILQNGGIIIRNSKATTFYVQSNRIEKVEIVNQHKETNTIIEGDYFFSTMPVKDLIAGISPGPNLEIKDIAKNLQYRDFITVGLLMKSLKIKNNKSTTTNKLISDNWIYIQESNVKLGRLQIFNNWSPHLVANPDYVWLGLEYFCNENDELWIKSDEEFIQFAINELASINIIDKINVIDSTIIRMPKAYPAYFGSYNEFNKIRKFTDSFENLFLIGRNGMHKYNNQDHSMLTAITAVENIKNNIVSKCNIWEINTEQEFHEKK